MPIKVTSIETMRDFFIWTHSPQPHIEERASLDEVVKLGIFAAEYGIPALSNQVTDMIRSNLASGDWKLHASVADDIYEAVEAGGPLREVIRAALGQLPRAITDLEEQSREEWRATILKHAQLGWDYIEASGSEWTRHGYLAGVCRFHDHEGMAYQNGFSASCDGCPYAQDECYPEWKEEETTNGASQSKEIPAAELVEPAASSDDTFHTATAEPALAPIEEEPAPELELAHANLAVAEEPQAQNLVESRSIDPEEPIAAEPSAEEPCAEEPAEELSTEKEPTHEQPILDETVWAFRGSVAAPKQERPQPRESGRRVSPEAEDEPHHAQRAYSLDTQEDEDPAQSEVNDVAPSEVSHSGSGSTEVNGIKSTQINGTIVPEAVIEEVDGPVETNGHVTIDDKDVQTSTLPVAAEGETPKSGKKSKKKKRGASVSQAKH